MKKIKCWIAHEQVTFLIKSVCVCVCVIITLSILNKIFMKKSISFQAVNSEVTELPYLSEKWDGFYEKDKNSIDMLFIGTSVVHTGVDVNYLYNQYGFTSYNLSADQMSGPNVYYYLKEAAKYQSPKVIFVDIQALSHAESADTSSIHYNYDFMRQGLNRIQGIKQHKKVSHEGTIFPFAEYHTRWQELDETDFKYVSMDKLNMLNGYFIYMLTNDSIVPTVYDKTEYTLSELGYEYTVKELDRILAFCKENGMECILFRTPQSYTQGQSQYCDAIEKYAGEKNIRFWNFNNYYEEIGVDFSTDFVDGQHLNYLGSRKFTAFLGTMIAAQLEYPDHRGTVGYEEWDAAYEYENYLIHAYQMRHYTVAQEYLDNNDYFAEELVYAYTYKNIDDLKKVIGMSEEINMIQDEEHDTKVCVMKKGELSRKVMLDQGETRTCSGLMEAGEQIWIESLEKGTKIWFGDNDVETKETDGVVDLLIYDKKLKKILDHVIVDTNAGCSLKHL